MSLFPSATPSTYGLDMLSSLTLVSKQSSSFSSKISSICISSVPDLTLSNKRGARAKNNKMWTKGQGNAQGEFNLAVTAEIVDVSDATTHLNGSANEQAKSRKDDAVVGEF